MIQAPVEIKGSYGEPTEIVPVTTLNRHEKSTVIEPKVKPKSKKDKIARPPNAFILYRQHHHPLVKSQFPNLHNNQICKSYYFFHTRFPADNGEAIMLGQQWQNETADIKAKFKSLAEDIKKKHLSAHPTYQYQPRKPAEKKRRMTRRKAEKLNAQATSSHLINDAAYVPEFEQTPAGNPTFTLGDASVEDATLLAMVQKHNADVLALAQHYNPNATPVLFHEQSEEVQDDVGFYHDLYNYGGMYPPADDANELLPMDAKVLGWVKDIHTHVGTAEGAFDHESAQRQTAEIIQQLGQFSTLWAPSTTNDEMRSL